MKKIIIIIVAACLIGASVFAITTCGKNEEVSLSDKIEDKISAYRTDLEDSSETLTSADAVRKYLVNWAESKGVSYEEDQHKNIIMKVESSDAYKAAPPTIVVCPYDAQNFDSCIDPMSVALYIAKNHEDTGMLTVIFTEDTGHTFNGIRNIEKEYFMDNANVFCLNGGSKNMWSTTTAGSSKYTFSSKVSHDNTKGNLAYRVTIEGLPGGIPDEKIGSYPNPIKELGDLLAYFKTNSLIFELARIDGGSSGSIYPESATAIIVIDENDHEKFEKRFNTAIENFNEKYQEHYPEVSYTFTEVPVPKTVLSSSSMNRLVSLLYTLIDGVYERNEEDEIIAISNIGAMSYKNGTYTIYASGNSVTSTGMNQIDLSYTTICGLSDVQYKKVQTFDSWIIEKPEENAFVQNVADAFKEYSGGNMEYRENVMATAASFVYQKNPNCNIMSVTVNDARIEKYTGTIITFMQNALEYGTSTEME